MKKEDKKKTSDLRRKAEKTLKSETTIESLSEEDVRKLAHELQIHQIELEMQNEELRKAQIEIEESHQKYSRLYDFAPVGYFTVSNKGIILESNLAGASMLGIERSLLVKQPLSKFMSKEDADKYYLHHRSVHAEKTYKASEIKMIKKDGTEFYAQLACTAIQNEDENTGQCLTVITDITEHRHAEESLRRSKVILDHAQKITHLGSWESDIINNKTVWSDEVFRQYGVTPQEFDGTNKFYLNHVHPDDKESAKEAIQDALYKGKPYNIDFRIILKNGSECILHNEGEIFLDENGKPFKMIGTTQDITEQKKAERYIKDLAKFPSENPNPVLRVAKNRKILFANSAGSILLDFWNTQVSELLPEYWNKRILDVLHFGKSNNYEMKCNDHIFSLTLAPVVDEGYVNIYGLDITERKKAELELSKSRQKSLLHVQQTPLAVIEWNTNFEVTEWNPAAEKIFGYRKEEALGRHAEFIIHETAKEHVDEVWQSLLSQRGGMQSTNENITRGGNIIFCEWYNTPLVSESGVVLGVASLVQDVTEVKLAEEKLKLLNETLEQHVAERTKELTDTNKKLHVEIVGRKQVEEELRLQDEIMKNMSEGVSLVGMEDARLIYTNPKFEEIFGYNTGELKGKHVSTLNAPVEKDPDETASKIIEELKERGEWHGEVHNIKKDGTLFWSYADISVFDHQKYGKVLVSTLSDITKRKNAEMALKESEIKYQDLYDNAPDMFTLIDAKTARITNCNQTLARALGYSKKEIIGQNIRFVYHPDCMELVEEVFKLFAKTGEVHNEELCLKQKDGSKIDVSLNVSSVRDEHGKILRSNFIWRDISQRKKMEEELVKMQKLESVGLLAGGIAHDFNNYLQGIMGVVTLADAYTSPDDEIHTKLEEAKQIIRQSKHLTQQLLIFSKGDEPVKSIIDINQFLKDVTSMSLSGSNIRCNHSMSDSLWPVEADRGQLNQVFNNLILNASQSMPEGGNIKIWAENFPVVKKNLLQLNEGMYVKIAIEDHGTGIPQENMTKIFDPYFSTRQEGSGLGLAISYSIIKNHNGVIRVASEMGVGTIFYLYLPALQKEILKEPVLSKDKAESTEKGPITHKGKILLMDDEYIIKLHTARNLRNLKYEVEEFGNGEEAITSYKSAMETGKPFDVVILDLTIVDGMGGEMAMEKLLEIDPDVKVIVVSGYVNNRIMTNFKEYGFREILSKPYEIEELDEVLQKVIKEES